MNYIKALLPMKDYRLFIEMESGSSIIVDLSIKLNTMKYKDLTNEELFKTASSDGNYVIWGEGVVKVTIKELMDVVMMGEYPDQHSGD